MISLLGYCKPAQAVTPLKYEASAQTLFGTAGCGSTYSIGRNSGSIESPAYPRRIIPQVDLLKKSVSSQSDPLTSIYQK